MTRQISASQLNEIEKDYFTFLIFAELEFDSGTVYTHNGIGILTWGGNDWMGVGDFGSISMIEEGPRVSPYEIVLALSGLDSTFSNEALTQNYYLRPITIYMGSINSDTGVLVADPDEIWSGKMDTMDITAGNVNLIRLTCESDLAIFDKVNGKRYTDQALQEDFSGDILLQYMTQMEDARVIWGGKQAAIFFTGGNGTTSAIPTPESISAVSIVGGEGGG